LEQDKVVKKTNSESSTGKSKRSGHRRETLLGCRVNPGTHLGVGTFVMHKMKSKLWISKVTARASNSLTRIKKKSGENVGRNSKFGDDGSKDESLQIGVQGNK